MSMGRSEAKVALVTGGHAARAQPRPLDVRAWIETGLNTDHILTPTKEVCSACCARRRAPSVRGPSLPSHCGAEMASERLAVTFVAFE